MGDSSASTTSCVVAARGRSARHTERDRREFALAFFRELRATVVDGGPPPLGPHILMGGDAGVKVANLVDNFAHAVLAPTEMICG